MSPPKRSLCVACFDFSSRALKCLLIPDRHRSEKENK
jgi:hypothetical protein